VGGARLPRWSALLLGELSYAVRHPRPWLEGLALNVVLSVLYLFWEPITGNHRAAWVILVGTYFSTFVLADVTTTNVLGHDRIRTRRSLAADLGIRSVLLRRNFVLLTLVAGPTLIATAVLTVRAGDSARLAYTLPSVAFPIFTWLGVGNIISVLMPVAHVPLRVRWRLRHHRAWNARWLAHLVLPYLLLYAVDPVADLPEGVFHHVRAAADHRPDLRALLIAVAGVAIWLGCTAISSRIVDRHGLVIR
jgi:hypothetical protein